MGSVINTNTLSLLTQNNLSKSQSAMETSIQRLSSGMRINSAKDDAAGQAIANRFSANIKGLTQAQRNANDGISLAQTTEGALNEVNNNLQRIRELAVQAANGSNSSADKASIQAEITQRLAEIDRTSAQTDFNGVKVLSANNNLSVQVGANDNETIAIELKKVDSTSLGMAGFSVSGNALPVSGEISTISAAAGTGSYDVNLDAAATALNTANGTTLTAADLSLREVQDADGAGTGKFVVKSGEDFFAASVDRTDGSVSLNTAVIKYADAANGIATASPVTLAAAPVKVGVNSAGAVNAFVTVQGKNYTTTEIDTEALVDSGINAPTAIAAGAVVIELSTAGAVTATSEFSGAATGNPLSKIDAALSTVDTLRGSLGAVQNRFDSVISNLGTTINNLTSSRSRIEDADYATEVSNMTRAQILQQAGTSVLAKANQSTQGVMSLLQ